jgi:tetratricopeptide (TPR) repeat protein
MKPAVFIGSSVEGLNVAYAVQQNLNYAAEVTVWDQGSFELSATNIESLIKSLDKFDFGIFIFTPDDKKNIRGDAKLTMRDNVLFELGLFIGRLGRERVFFVVPDAGEFYIPTDLAGINPAKYEAERADGNLQAATGAACNAIRQAIATSGVLTQREEFSGSSAVQEPSTIEKTGWLSLFLDDKIDEALEEIEGLLKVEKIESEKVRLTISKAYCLFRSDPVKGKRILYSVLEGELTVVNYHMIAYAFLHNGYFDDAISVCDIGLTKENSDIKLATFKAECMVLKGDLKTGTEVLRQNHIIQEPAGALKLTDIYINSKDYNSARRVIHQAYLNYPNHPEICYKYSIVVSQLGEHNVALFLLNKAVRFDRKNSTYWGYFSNCCVELELFDTALTANKKAEEYCLSKEAWIILNIGNIYNFKGLYTEAITHLKRGLVIEEDSEYGHDRLSRAIKAKSEEESHLSKIINDGQLALHEWKPIIDDSEEGLIIDL